MLHNYLLAHLGGAVQHDVLHGLPVHSLQLPDELDGVLGGLDLPRCLYGEGR